VWWTGCSAAHRERSRFRSKVLKFIKQIDIIISIDFTYFDEILTLASGGETVTNRERKET